MSSKMEPRKYKRKITGAEKFFLHSPFSIVTMVARIKGEVTQESLKGAVKKAQQRHTLLNVRIHEDEQHDLWFIRDQNLEIPVEIFPRKTENDWIKIHSEASEVPFEFETQPAIRFALVQSADISELVILCHHIICDGMSLAYLARDIMIYLGDPKGDFKILPDPKPVTRDYLPAEVLPSGIVKFFVKRIRQKWEDEIVYFDQEDYRSLTGAYWGRFQHEVITVQLSEKETAALVFRCKNEAVTVNSAITAAFSGALCSAAGDKKHHAKTAIGASVRDRLREPVGEAIGYYASGFELVLKYNQKINFWDNARNYHKEIKKSLSPKKLFGDFPAWLEMDSNIYSALNFKKLGKLVPSNAPRFEKLSGFSTREDSVVELLKRAKMETLETKLLGPAITNLGRLDFPQFYGDLELDRLIMQPGGAFPLVHVDMVIGAVTCAGKLSLVIEYTESAVNTETMTGIKDLALEYLLGK